MVREIPGLSYGAYDRQRSSDLKTWTKVTTLDQPATTAGTYYRLLRP